MQKRLYLIGHGRKDRQNRIKTLVWAMRKHLYGTELPLEPAFAHEIERHSKPEIIVGIFSMQSCVSQDLIVRLPDFMHSVDYQDPFQAFEIMQTDELALYHYRDFLAGIFGIDVAKMTGNRIRSSNKPSDWPHEYLSDRNIDQEQLRKRTQQQVRP